MIIQSSLCVCCAALVLCALPSKLQFWRIVKEARFGFVVQHVYVIYICYFVYLLLFTVALSEGYTLFFCWRSSSKNDFAAPPITYHYYPESLKNVECWLGCTFSQLSFVGHAEKLALILAFQEMIHVKKKNWNAALVSYVLLSLPLTLYVTASTATVAVKG